MNPSFLLKILGTSVAEKRQLDHFFSSYISPLGNDDV